MAHLRARRPSSWATDSSAASYCPITRISRRRGYIKPCTTSPVSNCAFGTGSIDMGECRTVRPNIPTADQDSSPCKHEKFGIPKSPEK